jgi:uncharacterized protein YcbK (DUF882 family)
VAGDLCLFGPSSNQVICLCVKIYVEANVRRLRNIAGYVRLGSAIFLAAAFTGGAHAQAHSLSAASIKPAGSEAASLQDHSLHLYNTHTNEKIDIVYRRGDQYIQSALARLDYFLRDHNTNEVRHFDPRLYDILSDLTASVGRPGGEIDIVCGYRSSATNAALRAHTNGVAKNSLHIQAEAIDLRMPAVNTLKLRKAALALARGGVGYYPHSDFIHVDVGRVRQWCFDCPASLLTGD